MIRVVLTCGKVGEKAARYAQALEAAGLEVVTAPGDEARSLEEMGAAGLLLSGGTDIDPSIYGQTLHPESDEPDGLRDRMEARLLAEALDRDLPVLGICRGLQFLNVFHQGTLVQHHRNQAMHRMPSLHDRSLPAHEVFVRPGSRLADILGAGACSVNSRHHQAADRVADQLVVSACATDGLVEGLERSDRRFVVGVQWHPEDMGNDARQRKLFEAFRDQVAGR